MPLVPRLPDHSSCYFSHLIAVAVFQGPVQPSPVLAHALPPSEVSSTALPWGKEPSLISLLSHSPVAHRPLPPACALKPQRLL